jgi:hypothetical protein
MPMASRTRHRSAEQAGLVWSDPKIELMTASRILAGDTIDDPGFISGLARFSRDSCCIHLKPPPSSTGEVSNGLESAAQVLDVASGEMFQAIPMPYRGKGPKMPENLKKSIEFSDIGTRICGNPWRQAAVFAT